MTKTHPTLGEISDEMAAKLAAEGDASAVDVAGEPAPAAGPAPEVAEAEIAPAGPNATVQGTEAEWIDGDKIRFHDGQPQIMTGDESDGA